MGFGTGHHESTRLCLAALQRTPLAGRSVVDVGTGSGVLAIAAARLGAAHASASTTIATRSTRPRPTSRSTRSPPGASRCARPTCSPRRCRSADVVLGNLTGALLRRAAATLSTAIARGGVLIVSGFTEDERLAIEHAFAPLAVVHAESEHGWLALTFGAPA